MVEKSEKKNDNKPLYKPMKSTRKGKKGMVYVMKNGAKRLIHFGDSSMGDGKSGASKAEVLSGEKRWY